MKKIMIIKRPVLGIKKLSQKTGLKNKAFTLVELIVVITILAILGTIGFLSFQNYNQYSRDTVRKSDLALISRGIKIKQVEGGNAPKPANAVEITASGTLIGWQGEFTSKIGKRYKLNGDFKDPLDGQNYIYSVDKNLNNFTIGGFLESDETAFKPHPNPLLKGEGIIGNTFAKEGRKLTTKGDKFGIILKDGEALTGAVDIVKTNEEYTIYFDDKEKIEGDGKILWKMIPNSSCARLQGLGKFSRKKTDEKGGKYEIINSQGKNITVYCDYNNKKGYLYSAIEDGDMEVEDSTQWEGLTKTTEDTHSGKYALKVAGYKTIKSSKFTYIDPTKKYKLEGWFKSAGSNLSKLYYGFAEYDEKFRKISPDYVNIIEGTETFLTNSVNSSDTNISFSKNGRECSDYITLGNRLGIVFDIDDSGNYNDLPNFNYYSNDDGADSITDNGDYCTVGLKTNVGLNYPTGTKIRMHYVGGSTYNYRAASDILVPNTWTKYYGEVEGFSKYGVNNNYFRRGTKYIKILILVNNEDNDLNKILYIDDLKLIEQ